MKHYIEILEEIRNNNNQIKELEAQADALLKKAEIAAADSIAEKIAIKRSIIEESETAANEKYNEIERIKSVNTILSENMKASFAAHVEPIIKDIMQKYNGKQYGPKTREKISKEAKQHGIAFYFNSYTGNYKITVYCLTNEGYKAYSMPEIDIHATDEAGHTTDFISKSNTIQDISKINFSTRYKYTENPDEKRDLLKAAYQEFKAFLEQAAAAEKRLNDMLPDGKERFNVIGYLSPWKQPF